MKNNRPNVEAIYKNMAFIWLGLFSSQIMFVIVALVAKPELTKIDFGKPPLGDQPAVVIAIILFAVSAIAASFFVKSSFHNRAVSEQSPGLVQTAMLIACAMCESASIMGVLLAFLFSYQYFFIPIVIGMAGMAFHFPSRTSLINATFEKKL